MVDDIHFQQNLPGVSNTKRVKKAGRQSKEKQNPSFKQYLKQNKDQPGDTEDDQKRDKKSTNKNLTHQKFGNDAAAGDEPEDVSQGKRIDTHA
jgi:hypothetical protein